MWLVPGANLCVLSSALLFSFSFLCCFLDFEGQISLYPPLRRELISPHLLRSRSVSLFGCNLLQPHFLPAAASAHAAAPTAPPHAGRRRRGLGQGHGRGAGVRRCGARALRSPWFAALPRRVDDAESAPDARGLRKSKTARIRSGGMSSQSG